MIFLNDFIVRREDSKSTRRLYKMSCDACNADRGYQRKSKHGLGLCKICVAKKLHKGVVRSKSTRDKMSKNHYLNNGGQHPLYGKRHKTSTKAKLSAKAANQNKNYLAIHQYSGPNGNILMKSSWELKYANWLDSKGITWVYEPEFKLSNGYSYLPDFQLSNGDIIEIKGYMREDAQNKWTQFCEDYPNLNKYLLRKNDMKNLGLI